MPSLLRGSSSAVNPVLVRPCAQLAISSLCCDSRTLRLDGGFEAGNLTQNVF